MQLDYFAVTIEKEKPVGASDIATPMEQLMNRTLG